MLHTVPLLLNSFSQQGWWALPLPVCLKVLGFHQLKKSRQGQGRWMTSMASRYFQGRVIETNEPCYISWDTESCCSKIQSLIELKLEAPNLSTDHQCHGAPEEELSQSACFTGLPPSFFFFFFQSLFSPILCASTHMHAVLRLHRFSGLIYLPQRENWNETESLSNPYILHSSIRSLISDCEGFHHS